MDFFEVVKERRSVRAYSAQTLEADLLQEILQALNHAPSAGNLQSFEVYVISDSNRKIALAKAANDQEFLTQPPIVLVFCTHAARSAARYGSRGSDLYCVQDATIACTYAMLAAAALGLSTVWVGAFDEDQVRRVLNAPEAHRPVAMLPIGYAAEAPEGRSRRTLSDLIHLIE